jgi:multidrug transporter EmrE-like cation transporter
MLFTSFTFYVTFVQYALLRYVHQAFGVGEAALAPGFALMAGFGIAGGLIVGRWIDREPRHMPQLTQLAAILSSLLAVCAIVMLQVEHLFLLQLLFAPLGLLLGVLIVVLLTLFTTRIPHRVLGIMAGFTAGAVYAVSNVIAAISASPARIGTFDTVLIASNLLVVILFADSLAPQPENRIGNDISPLKSVVRLWPLALVVAIDTALFVLVSRAPGETPVLAAWTDWFKNGAAHLLAAALAGIFYARLGWRKLTWIAAGALVALIAFFIAHRLGLALLGGPIIVAYSVVVGVYTVALFTVFAEETSRRRPATGIALGMVLVGWVASPLGLAIGTFLLQF